MTDKRIMTTVPSMSAEDSLIKTAIGSVSVLLGMEPAIVIVAPNSPKAFAQVNMEAEIMDGLTRIGVAAPQERQVEEIKYCTGRPRLPVC